MKSPQQLAGKAVVPLLNTDVLEPIGYIQIKPVNRDFKPTTLCDPTLWPKHITVQLQESVLNLLPNVKAHRPRKGPLRLHRLKKTIPDDTIPPLFGDKNEVCTSLFHLIAIIEDIESNPEQFTSILEGPDYGFIFVQDKHEKFWEIRFQKDGDTWKVDALPAEQDLGASEDDYILCH
jgi:hypothetical protein